MLLVKARDLRHFFGSRCIIDIPAIDIYMADRIGLVGRNGEGKTTLLRILVGELAPEEGLIETYGRAGYLSQLVEDGGNRGYLSGGERTRERLARLFADSPHLLVLDEPTTNLDIQGIEKLERDLQSFRGAVLVVSHDRELLDSVCTQIWELERSQLKVYSGNYTAYYQMREQQLEAAWAEYQSYLKERRHLEEAIRTQESKARSTKKAPSRMGVSEARLHKGTARTRKAKVEQGAKSLKSRLERLEVKEKPFEMKGPSIDLQPPRPVYNQIVLRVESLSIAFPGKQLLQGVNFTIRRGDKAALIGPNGSGKTTLLKKIVQGAPEIEIAGSVKLGYFSQTLDILDGDKTVLENVEETAVYPRQLVRLVLGRLLFRGDDVHKKVSLLSGGERVKCAFAKVFLQDINFLVLDEPTNYLDIDSIEALAEVIKEYGGTVLFVSHDRRFISQTANQILSIEERKISSFAGSYAEFQKRRKAVEQPTEESLLVLENRLADLTSRLSMSGPDDDTDELDRQFREVVAQIRKIKSQRS